MHFIPLKALETGQRIRYSAECKEKTLEAKNLKTIILTTKRVHSEPGWFADQAVRVLAERSSGITEVVAYWPDMNRVVAVRIESIHALEDEDLERLGYGWVMITGSVHNDSLFTDGRRRNVPVKALSNLNGFDVELSFDANCPAEGDVSAEEAVDA